LQDELDVFQKVIFNLMRSGDYDVDQLSNFSRLDPDLVRILLEKLHENGLLEKIGESKYRCHTLNDSNESESEELGEQTVGWIFQQSWTGRLLPAFYTHLPIQPASAAGESSRTRKLSFGDEAETFHIWAQYLRFPSQTAVKPTPLDVIRAIGFRGSKEFKERHSALRVIPRHLDQDAMDKCPSNIKRVKFLTTEPQPVYLTTAALVFDSEPDDWHVCCPVGTGLSPELRDQILRSSEEGDADAELIVSQLCEKTRLGDIYEWANAHRDFIAHARRETLSAFGPAIESYPDLLNNLDAFHDFWARLRGTDEEPPQHLLATVFLAARYTLESLIKEFANQYPMANLHAYLTSKDENENTDIVMKWLNESGYDTDGINGLFLVSRSWLLKSACDSANYYMMKNVIGAISLQAKVQEDHPLRTAAETYPAFFLDLKRLLSLGNAAAHDNSHVARDVERFTKEVALSIRQPLVRIVRALLDPSGTIFKQD